MTSGRPTGAHPVPRRPQGRAEERKSVGMLMKCGRARHHRLDRELSGDSCRDRYRSAMVCPKDRGARNPQRFQRAWGRMAKEVVAADGDDRNARMDGRDKRGTRRIS